MDELIFPRPPLSNTHKHFCTPCEKGRDPYDGLRLWSAITHGSGALLAILGSVLLLLRCASLGSSAWHFVTVSLYGFTMILLYTASTLYHCIRVGTSGRIALRKLDHCSIYLLIAGTYTPICLIPLRGPWGWSLFGIIWALALLGIAVSLFWIHSPRWVTAGICIFMGWLAITAIVPLAAVLSWRGLFWLLLGGVLYTIGGVLYALKWPGRNNPHFGCHEIFHIFILLGSISHYLLMYRVIAPL